MSALEIETDYTDDPVCPHCGHAEKDAWEIDFGPGLDGTTELECSACRRDYFCERNCQVTYSSHVLRGGE
jgi:hypothetical protein